MLTNDFTPMDKLDERNFVRAVDSAATITMANPERDRNEILAGQLKAAGVPFKYAKLASVAFNKRFFCIKNTCTGFFSEFFYHSSGYCHNVILSVCINLKFRY